MKKNLLLKTSLLATSLFFSITGFAGSGQIGSASVNSELSRWLADKDVPGDASLDIGLYVKATGSQALRQQADLIDWYDAHAEKDIHVYGEAENRTYVGTKKDFLQLLANLPDYAVVNQKSELWDLNSLVAKLEPLQLEAIAHADIHRAANQTELKGIYEKALVIIQKDFMLKKVLNDDGQKLLAAGIVDPILNKHSFRLEVLINYVRGGSPGPNYSFPDNQK